MSETAPDRLMHIAVSGSTGLVGSALCDRLSEEGREVRPIVRGELNDREIRWDTRAQTFDATALSQCDAVIHLAGENIMGRWTDEKKQRIYDSRIDSTRALSQTLANLSGGPRTFIAASATGYYGYSGQGEAFTEDDRPGDGFLADVCVGWEAAADPAREAGIRVVHVRIGFVLSPQGGALKQMLPPFKLGLGGPIGNGQQWMSWIGLRDLVSIIVFCIDTPGVSGPINAVAPEPITNRGFTIALGRVINRPTLLPIPSFAPRLIYGKECANATALGSFRVVPKRLADAGFQFQFADLDSALRHELGRA